MKNGPSFHAEQLVSRERTYNQTGNRRRDNPACTLFHQTIMSSNTVYIGLKGHVAAIDTNDGRTLWQTKLRHGAVSGHRFVSLLVEEARIFAHTHGELYCLDAETGRVLWNNPLDGLGYDIASIAVAGASASALPAAEYRRQKAAAAAAGASHGGGGDH